MSLAFHAVPPPGEWLNDPNALIRHGGEYRLFAQHRADGPAFRRTGWLRLSSPDLLTWRCDSVVLPPVGDAWRYSGSVVDTDGRLEAFHTLHDAGSTLEAQSVAVSDDGGATWCDVAHELVGAPARNRRDPFVIADGTGWAMLLAEPCDWTDWATEPPSRLSLYRSTDRRAWTFAGAIGPWAPPGVMWEVPVLARLGEHDMLFVSQVDRRGGGADCSVRAWAGRLASDGFTVAAGWPVAGARVDLGPDFYAMMVAGFDTTIAVGWASSWHTASAMRWPGFAGGPISLPRQLGMASRGDDLVLTQAPLAASVAAFATLVAVQPVAGLGTARFSGGVPFVLTVAEGAVRIAGDPASGTLTVSRAGGPPFDWQAVHDGVLVPCPERQLEIFVDGPLVEVFLSDGLAVTVALPCDQAQLATLTVAGTDFPLAWSVC